MAKSQTFGILEGGLAEIVSLSSPPCRVPAAVHLGHHLVVLTDEAAFEAGVFGAEQDAAVLDHLLFKLSVGHVHFHGAVLRSCFPLSVVY